MSGADEHVAPFSPWVAFSPVLHIPKDRDLLIAAWLWIPLIDHGAKLSHEGKSVIPEEHLSVLAPLMALIRFGSSEQMISRRDEIFENLEHIWTFIPDEEKRDQSLALKMQAGRFNIIIERLKDAERLLAENGYRFDATSRKAVKLPGAGGRPGDLLPRLIEKIACALRPGNSFANTLTLREAIRHELELFFDSSDLSPASGELIDRTLRDYLRSKARLRSD